MHHAQHLPFSPRYLPHSQCQEREISSVTGTVTRIGYYRDTLPKLIIAIRKKECPQLQCHAGERAAITFVVNGDSYLAGLRTTERDEMIRICSVIHDNKGVPVRLSDVLFSHGWSSGRLSLTCDGDVIHCSI
jgi:hypothetical protein